MQKEYAKKFNIKNFGAPKTLLEVLYVRPFPLYFEGKRGPKFFMLMLFWSLSLQFPLQLDPKRLPSLDMTPTCAAETFGEGGSSKVCEAPGPPTGPLGPRVSWGVSPRVSRERGCGVSKKCPRSRECSQSVQDTFGRGNVQVYRGTGISRGVRRTTWDRSLKNWELQSLVLKSFSGEGTLWDFSLPVSLTLWDTLALFTPPLPLPQHLFNLDTLGTLFGHSGRRAPGIIRGTLPRTPPFSGTFRPRSKAAFPRRRSHLEDSLCFFP